MTRKIYELGQIPELSVLPEKMLSQLIRQSHSGEPRAAFQPGAVRVAAIGPQEVFVHEMAARVNCKNVGAGLGIAIDVIKIRRKTTEKGNCRTGGSDDPQVVATCAAAESPMSEPPQRIWENSRSGARLASRQPRARRGKPSRRTKGAGGGIDNTPTHRVFLTHSSADTWVAEQIADAISECGATPFLDERHIHVGADFEEDIRVELSKADELVFLVTPWALERHHVWIEVGAAWLREIPIIGLLYGISVEELQALRGVPLLKSRDLLCLNKIAVYLQQLRARISTEPGPHSPC
jgi:hypothetical protein